jgi:hypothetical protein
MCTTSLCSKFCKIILLVRMYKDNMDGLYVRNSFALVATPGSLQKHAFFFSFLILFIETKTTSPLKYGIVIGEIFGHIRLSVASPTGYMLTSSGFPLSNQCITFSKFLQNDRSSSCSLWWTSTAGYFSNLTSSPATKCRSVNGEIFGHTNRLRS